MRLDKMQERLSGFPDGSMFDRTFTHYIMSDKYLGHRRAMVVTATDELPRKYVAQMIWEARKQLRVEFSRLERNRKKAERR